MWVPGKYGADTFYYGRGAGPHPTGVAVVSDLMRVARESAGSPDASPRSPTRGSVNTGPFRSRCINRPTIFASAWQDRPASSRSSPQRSPPKTFPSTLFSSSPSQLARSSLRHHGRTRHRTIHPRRHRPHGGAEILVEPPLAVPMEKSYETDRAVVSVHFSRWPRSPPTPTRTIRRRKAATASPRRWIIPIATRPRSPKKLSR